jgi:hypothetical protein
VELVVFGLAKFIFHSAPNTPQSMDPVPLHKQKAILQVQEEGLEDHEVVAIIEHFQSDISIADLYLSIKKDSICKRFLIKYSK